MTREGRPKDGPELTAGVDWLSVSCSDEERPGALWRTVNALLCTEEPVPFERKHWHVRAFSGYQTESYALATDGEYVIAQLRGGQADRHWKSVLPFADNVSRIDLQVTVNATERRAGVAEEVYRRARAGANRGGRPPSCSLVVNSDQGQTAYVGRRTSDFFLRVYDKGVQGETAPPGCSWRWEVEVKGLPAWHLAKTIANERWAPELMAAYVRRQFQLRGVEPDWETSGSVSVAPLLREQKDDRRSLEWFRQAAPHTLARLVRHGFGAEVLEVLYGVPGLYDMLGATGAEETPHRRALPRLEDGSASDTEE